MSEVPEIRKMGPEDSEAVAAIIRKSFQDIAERFSLTAANCPRHPSNCTVDWVISDSARGVVYFILWQEGRAVGCVGMEESGTGLCHLERLAVLPEWRHMGYGRALVEHVLSHAEARGILRVRIGTIAEHSELKEWYARLGFVETETRSFEHLPFRVTFMEHRLDGTGRQIPDDIGDS